MNVRSYCVEYYLLPDTKITQYLNIGALLKGVLFDLRARNFVHAKVSLPARCVHARHRAHNLSSPVREHKHEILVYATMLPFNLIHFTGLFPYSQKTYNFCTSYMLIFERRSCWKEK